MNANGTNFGVSYHLVASLPLLFTQGVFALTLPRNYYTQVG